jgi:hypothetical protein
MRGAEGLGRDSRGGPRPLLVHAARRGYPGPKGDKDDSHPDRLQTDQEAAGGEQNQLAMTSTSASTCRAPGLGEEVPRVKHRSPSRRSARARCRSWHDLLAMGSSESGKVR